MIEVRAYEPAQLALIEPREYERALRGLDYAQAFARGPAFTIWDDGRCVAAGGIVIHWEGVGEAWLYLSDWIYPHALSFVKVIKERLEAIIREHRLVRVQTPLCALMPTNIRFARALGFRAEGVLRKYGPDGSDYIMHAIVRETECLRQ